MFWMFCEIINIHNNIQNSTHLGQYPRHLKKPPCRPEKYDKAEKKYIAGIYRLGHCHKYQLPADVDKDYVPDKTATAHSTTISIHIPTPEPYLFKPGKHSLAIFATLQVRIKDNRKRI